jgi:hypothetical protein
LALVVDNELCSYFMEWERGISKSSKVEGRSLRGNQILKGEIDTIFMGQGVALDGVGLEKLESIEGSTNTCNHTQIPSL